MTIRPGISRPDWDTFYLGIAEAASKRGDCIRRKVGAVLVKEYDWGTVTSLGYNGSEPGGPSCLAGECPRCLSDAPSGSSYEGCVERHGEANAIDNATFDVEWATMYITCAPCTQCQGLMSEHGIKRVVWPAGEMYF